MRLFSRLFSSLQRHRRALAIALLCTSLGALHAQATANADSADPPSRVARLSYLSGDIGFLPAGAQDWSDADVNRPLTTGDRLSSSHNGRAELEFGGAVLRMDNRTDVTLLDLNEKMAQVELSEGTLSLSVLHLDAGQTYEIDTPTVALVIDQPGTFRVDINDEGGSSSTRVTAFNGDATVYGENNTQRPVYAGRSYRFVDSSLSAVAISDIGGGDSFDAWVNARDQRYARGDSNQYVPDDMVGTPDLREYGSWDDSSDYGAVWYPNDVGPDWAPYRTGHWAYIAPWGWTWIDDMPWGYAPYHYGRWAHTDRGWGWIPGPRDVIPVYAPALVVFVGGNVSIGFGGPVGWFPLGPDEIYNPWYHCDRDYYARVNRNNMRRDRRHDERSFSRRIDEHYASFRDNRPMHGDRYINRDAPHGLTAMSGRDFAEGQAVQHHRLRDDRQLASAPIRARGAELRPLGKPTAVRSAHVRNLPLNGFRREVVARHAPPQRRVERIDRSGVSTRVVLPVAHVRVLNPVPARPGGPGRNGPDNRNAPAGTRPNLPRGSNVIPNAPILQRRTDGGSGPTPQPGSNELPSARFAHPSDHGTPTGNRPNLPRGSNVIPNAPVLQRRNETPTGPAPSRSNELPSARFAHPSGNGGPERVSRQPRPGVSFIAPDNRNRPAANQPDARLPRAPRIEPAAPVNRGVPRETGRQPIYNAPRQDNYRPRAVEPRPRVEPVQRSPVLQQPRPMPSRNEAPRQVMQAPRYSPPPRNYAPPVRAEAPRPQPRQAPPAREEPRKHDDGHQR